MTTERTWHPYPETNPPYACNCFVTVHIPTDWRDFRMVYVTQWTGSEFRLVFSCGRIVAWMKVEEPKPYHGDEEQQGSSSSSMAGAD